MLESNTCLTLDHEHRCTSTVDAGRRISGVQLYAYSCTVGCRVCTVGVLYGMYQRWRRGFEPAWGGRKKQSSGAGSIPKKGRDLPEKQSSAAAGAPQKRSRPPRKAKSKKAKPAARKANATPSFFSRRPHAAVFFNTTRQSRCAPSAQAKFCFRAHSEANFASPAARQKAKLQGCRRAPKRSPPPGKA